MNRYAAFLRAINVGGHTIKMQALKHLLEGLGYQDIITYIQSGNILFSSPLADSRLLERQVEEHLNQNLGYPVATFIRTPPQLVEIVQNIPFAVDQAIQNTESYIAFLQAEPNPIAQQKVMGLQNSYYEFFIRSREVYWLRRKLPGEPPFSGAALEKALGAPATVRNLRTVLKMIDLLDLQ